MQNPQGADFAAEVSNHLSILWANVTDSFRGTTAEVFSMADEAMKIKAATAEEAAFAVKSAYFAVRSIAVHVNPDTIPDRLSCYSPSRNAIVLDWRCSTSSVYSTATVLHELGHAFQRSSWGRIAFNQMFSEKKSTLVAEADAWRTAFLLAKKHRLLVDDVQLQAAYRYAKACLKTYDR